MGLRMKLKVSREVEIGAAIVTVLRGKAEILITAPPAIKILHRKRKGKWVRPRRS